MAKQAVLLIHGDDWAWPELTGCLNTLPRIGEIQEATEIDTARRLIQQSSPDLVLCQPDLNGVSTAPLVDALRSNPDHRCQIDLISLEIEPELLATFQDMQLDGVFCWSDIPHDSCREFLTVLAAGPVSVVGRHVDSVPPALIHPGSDDAAIVLSERQRRLLRLKYHLPNPTLDKLAAELGIGKATVQRELRAIRDAFDVTSDLALGVQATLYGQLP